MLNLAQSDIHTMRFFAALPRFESVVFKGFVDAAVQYYEAEREGEKCAILATTIIRKEDKFIWESCQDLLDRSVKEAAQRVGGVYTFDVLCFDLYREIETFNVQELAQLLTNHARKLQVGEQSLIKYSSCFGVLKRISVEDWGKIIFKSFVDIFAKEPKQFDLLVKRLINLKVASAEHKVIVMHDVSQEPIFNPRDTEQKERLVKIFEKQVNLFEEMPEFYISDKNHLGPLYNPGGSTPGVEPPGLL